MVDNYYDDIASGYDELYGKEQLDKLNIIKSNISIDKDSKILDIGCGSGISSSFDCYLIGIDPSSELIKIAQQKSIDNNFYNHIFHVAKCENIKLLEFSKNEFDFVISISAIHHVENLKQLIPELKRIGKKFIFTILNRLSNKENIINIINNNFKITKRIDESKDIILFFE